MSAWNFTGAPLFLNGNKPSPCSGWTEDTPVTHTLWAFGSGSSKNNHSSPELRKDSKNEVLSDFFNPNPKKTHQTASVSHHTYRAAGAKWAKGPDQHSLCRRQRSISNQFDNSFPSRIIMHQNHQLNRPFPLS